MVARPLPPADRTDILLFIGYLLDGQDRVTSTGHNHSLVLIAERRNDGTVYHLEYTKDGRCERVFIATVSLAKTVEFYLFQRGEWQKLLENWYNLTRRRRPTLPREDVTV